MDSKVVKHVANLGFVWTCNEMRNWCSFSYRTSVCSNIIFNCVMPAPRSQRYSPARTWLSFLYVSQWQKYCIGSNPDLHNNIHNYRKRLRIKQLFGTDRFFDFQKYFIKETPVGFDKFYWESIYCTDHLFFRIEISPISMKKLYNSSQLGVRK